MVSRRNTIDGGLKAISDTTRRRILSLLKKRQLSVLEIAEEFPMSRPAISKHLRILKEAGLVVETPAGRQRLYALEKAPLQLLVAWLTDFSGGAEESPSVTPVLSPRVRRRSASSPRPALPGDGWRVW